MNFKAINFALMFGLALLTAYFTLENTASTTINIIPGISLSIPIAALVIFAAGFGACSAWSFVSWSDKLREQEINELEETKKTLKKLELDFNRLKSTKEDSFPEMNSSAKEDSYGVNVASSK